MNQISPFQRWWIFSKKLKTKYFCRGAVFFYLFLSPNDTTFEIFDLKYSVRNEKNFNCEYSETCYSWFTTPEICSLPKSVLMKTLTFLKILYMFKNIFSGIIKWRYYQDMTVSERDWTIPKFTKIVKLFCSFGL